MDNLKILQDYLSYWDLEDSGKSISYERVKNLDNWIEIHWDKIINYIIYIHIRYKGKDITRKVNTREVEIESFISFIKMIEKKIWIEEYRDEVLKYLLDGEDSSFD